MPRVAIHTLKEAADLSHNAVEEVILSRDLWDLTLGQLVPEEDGRSTSSSSSSNIRDHKGEPSRVAIAISRRYKFEGVPTRRKSNTPISSIVCWACLDSSSSNNSELQQQQQQKNNDKSRSLSNNKASTSTTSHLRITQRLRKKYSDILGLSNVTLDIRPTQPIKLSQVFLLARNSTSYEHASNCDVELQSYLALNGRILRQGEVIDVLVPSSNSTNAATHQDRQLTNGHRYTNGHTDTISFQVTLTEPVLQGYISEIDCEVIVLPPISRNSDKANVNNYLKPISSSSLQSTNGNSSSSSNSRSKDEEDWHVDEDFLAAGIDSSFGSSSHLLPPLHYLNTSTEDVSASGNGTATSSTWQSPLSTPSLPSAQLEASLSESNARLLNNKGRLVRVTACNTYIDEEDLTPSIIQGQGEGKYDGPSEDEHLRAYVKASDLSKLGLFSGDRIEIVALGNEGSKRAVRVYGLRNPPSTPDNDLWLILSPVLLHNMGNPPIVRLNSLLKSKSSSSSSSSSRVKNTSLLKSKPSSSSSINAAAQEEQFPIAKSISIARIASEHSMQKKYQHLFITALKNYFKTEKRILKEGDLLAVPIDSLKSFFYYKENAGESGSNGGEVQEEEHDFELPNAPSIPTAVAYFSVSKLELPSSANGSTGGISSGKYGCHIDPSTTTMIQTGLTNSPVPDAFGYLGIAEATSPDILQVAPHGQESIPSRLMDFVKASSMKHTSDLNINLTVLLKGARGSGKATMVRQVSQLSGFHLLELDCYELLGDTDTKTEGNLAARFDRAASCTPCILLLRHIEALARKSQVLETGQEPTIASTFQDCLKVAQDARKTTGYPLILVGTTCDADKIPLSVLGLFKEEFSIEAPAEAERLAMLQNMLANDILSPDVSVKSLAVQTAALVANDLADLCERARKHAVSRLLDKQLPISACKYAGVALTAADFMSALDHARSSYSESIGAPKIPNVTWDDVGGLAKVKTEILDTIQLPLQHPELFEEGLKKRSGVLLYGPPGTGKTLLAKAVATSCSLNFFSVKGPELLNMYIGESEANVRRVFQRARDAKPCVIFFDELDSVAPKRGNQGDSGGVMDRIVSQLLAELDGMSEGNGGADVFVIGATNRPDLLDPALLRPGRFDRMLYLGVSDNHDAQLKIIEALTRKFKLEPECDLAAIAAQCPFNYTGADFYALCSDALLKAMSRKAEAVDARIAELNATPEYARNKLTPQYYLAELARPEEMQVTVSQQDFELALGELVPSVSEAEMLHYKVVQQRFNPDTQEVAVAKVDKKGKGKARQV